VRRFKRWTDTLVLRRSASGAGPQCWSAMNADRAGRPGGSERSRLRNSTCSIGRAPSRGAGAGPPAGTRPEVTGCAEPGQRSAWALSEIQTSSATGSRRGRGPAKGVPGRCRSYPEGRRHAGQYADQPEDGRTRDRPDHGVLLLKRLIQGEVAQASGSTRPSWPSPSPTCRARISTLHFRTAARVEGSKRRRRWRRSARQRTPFAPMPRTRLATR